MANAKQQAAAIIREALNELAEYGPNQIAEKIAAAGMLWCETSHLAIACPIHHWLQARLEAHGLEDVSMYVGPDDVVIPDGLNSHVMPLPEPVATFLFRFDRSDYRDMETRP